jgi:hypothetical protein
MKLNNSPDWCSATTYNGIRTKNRPVWITPGAAPMRWMGPIRNPCWEQKRTEDYVIVSTLVLTNLPTWNLLSVRHFVYKLLFHVHLPRFGDILIWINRSKSSLLFAVKFFIFGIQIHIWIGSAHHESIRKVPWQQNVGQKEDFMHSNFQMDISLLWIDAAFT